MQSMIKSLQKLNLDLDDLFSAAVIFVEELEFLQKEVDKELHLAVDKKDFEKIQQLSEVAKKIQKQIDFYESIANTGKFCDDKNEDEFLEVDELDEKELESCEFKKYGLFKDWTWKRPVKFEFMQKSFEAKTFKDILLQICEELYKIDSELFKSFLDGSKFERSKNFSYEKKALREARKMANVDIFVETNTNAGEVRKTILGMLKIYGIANDVDTFCVYLRNVKRGG